MEKYTSLKQDLSNEHKELLQNSNFLKRYSKDIISVADMVNIITSFYYLDNEGSEVLKKISICLTDEIILELANIFIHKYRASEVTRGVKSGTTIKWYDLNAKNFDLNQKELDMGINLLNLYDKNKEAEIKGWLQRVK